MVSMIRTDADVVRDIQDAFRASLLIPDEEIRITAANGTVWLEGNVTWKFERMAAIDRALDVPGVGAVYNRIEVAAHPRRVAAIIAAPCLPHELIAMTGAAQM
jgi:osmotically-inducible protein OsmY